jgi:hypothetical protein
MSHFHASARVAAAERPFSFNQLGLWRTCGGNGMAGSAVINQEENEGISLPKSADGWKEQDESISLPESRDELTQLGMAGSAVKEQGESEGGTERDELTTRTEREREREEKDNLDTQLGQLLSHKKFSNALGGCITDRCSKKARDQFGSDQGKSDRLLLESSITFLKWSALDIQEWPALDTELKKLKKREDEKREREREREREQERARLHPPHLAIPYRCEDESGVQNLYPVVYALIQLLIELDVLCHIQSKHSPAALEKRPELKDLPTGKEKVKSDLQDFKWFFPSTREDSTSRVTAHSEVGEDAILAHREQIAQCTSSLQHNAHRASSERNPHRNLSAANLQMHEEIDRVDDWVRVLVRTSIVTDLKTMFEVMGEAGMKHWFSTGRRNLSSHFEMDDDLKEQIVNSEDTRIGVVDQEIEVLLNLGIIKCPKRLCPLIGQALASYKRYAVRLWLQLDAREKNPRVYALKFTGSKKIQLEEYG